MGRKNKRQKIETFEIPKDLLIEAKKPRYNAFQGGYGIQGQTKYKRKEKYKKDYRYDY